MIEKEFNDRIYTKSTAKREKYTIFMLQNIGLFPLLDSPHTCVYKKKRLSGNFWLLSFKISDLCLPLFYETRTTPSCHPSGCAYRQL